jgi:hypothetical protein
MRTDPVLMETFADLLQDAALGMRAGGMLVLCRDVAGKHIGGTGCWCRPVSYTRADIRSQTITAPGLDS